MNEQEGGPDRSSPSRAESGMSGNAIWLAEHGWRVTAVDF